MKTLVTGAAGHLGSNLVRELVRRGIPVRAMVHGANGASGFKGVNVDLIEGDLLDRDSLRAAIRDCSRVYHLAAFVSIRSGDRQKLFEVNVLGTRNLMQEARSAGVQRVVHCSSLGAVGLNSAGASNEEWSLSPYEETTDYELSKAFAELEVYKEIVRGLDAVIVNPSGTVGPWDFKPSLVGRTIVDYAHGKMKAYVDGSFDFVPMRDVVEGHILAMEKGKTGERYLLTGEQVSIGTTLEWLEELTGVPKPKVIIPAGLLQRVAVVKDWVERKFFPHVYPRFNYHSIRLLRSGKRGDHSKAVSELGLRPTSVKAAYAEAVDWFRSYDYIPDIKSSPSHVETKQLTHEV